MFLLAMVAVIGCAWALVRYYSRPRTPMVLPAAPSSSEIPVEVEAP